MRVRYHDTYGFRDMDLTQVCHLLEPILQVRFASHDSHFRGGEYYRYDDKFILQKNWDSLDNRPIEADYPDVTVLLYASDLDDPREIERLILHTVPNAVLLRREVTN